VDLILWRHADAENGYPDEARALTTLGRNQAEKAGDWLARRLPKDTVILVSPAVRAQQTAQFAGRPFRTEPRVGLSAGPQDILAAANWGEVPGTTLVVGHQPTLGRTVSELLVNENADWPFEKAAIWWFSCSVHGVVLRAALPPDLV
jgi:phosphohistidine phosphatase